MHLPVREIDTIELLERLREGDRQAFNTIYLTYRSELYDIAFRRLGDRQQAEDLVQDVFFSLWNKRESRRIGDLPAYLHTAIRYRVFSFAARHKQIRLFEEPILWATEKDGPEEQLIRKELLACIYAYAERLPRKRKRIFLLYMHSRMSTTEIAEELNVSVKTVQNQLGTAIDGLYELVAPAASLAATGILLRIFGQ